MISDGTCLLKPCPFCGRKPVMKLYPDAADIRCTSCKVQMLVTCWEVTEDCEEVLIERWNRRDGKFEQAEKSINGNDGQ